MRHPFTPETGSARAPSQTEALKSSADTTKGAHALRQHCRLHPPHPDEYGRDVIHKSVQVIARGSETVVADVAQNIVGAIDVEARRAPTVRVVV
jgi:hypothetical protein